MGGHKGSEEAMKKIVLRFTEFVGEDLLERVDDFFFVKSELIENGCFAIHYLSQPLNCATELGHGIPEKVIISVDF